MEELKVKSLYADLGHTLAAPLLATCEYPWEALAPLSDFIRELGQTLSEAEFDRVGEDVWIAKTAKVAPSASVNGPCIICDGAEIRHCAYIRGSVIVGAGSVVGNSCEIKNSILFDSVQVPHFNYVGDSILGYKSHMGAGSITSNVKSDKTLVSVKCGEKRIETGRKKFGAMLGDFVEVGCNSVLNPGTVIGAHTNVYPLSSVRGYVPQNSIHKSSDQIVAKRKD